MRELCVWVGVRHIRWSAEMGMGVPFEPGGTRRGLCGTLSSASPWRAEVDLFSFSIMTLNVE